MFDLSHRHSFLSCFIFSTNSNTEPFLIPSVWIFLSINYLEVVFFVIFLQKTFFLYDWVCVTARFRERNLISDRVLVAFSITPADTGNLVNNTIRLKNSFSLILWQLNAWRTATWCLLYILWDWAWGSLKRLTVLNTFFNHILLLRPSRKFCLCLGLLSGWWGCMSFCIYRNET